VRSWQHYLPVYTERVKWTDRTVVAERPLFTGYVFVRSTPEQNSVISLGVLRLLGDDARAMVSEEELLKIRYVWQWTASATPSLPSVGPP